MSDSDLGPFPAAIAREIWQLKYRFVDPFTGTIHDQTVEDTWRRIANALAEPEIEEDRASWAQEFYSVLADFVFIPAGRIVAGAGTKRRVTLFNCYVMGTIPDSMDGIFESLKEAALTMQQGGGIGYDFSPLRPKGAPVNGVGADASGPLTFMDAWDSMCRTVMSAGSRRGAMMATMRCDHPDIEAFIEAKQDGARLRMFNVSVLVTDKFMAAVKANQRWDLTFNGEVYKTIEARDLWDKIMAGTYAYAEPGVIFIDRVNEDNNLSYMETISATNPCGEQPLPPYGACLLGSLNLARLVENAYEPNAGLDIELLKRAVRVAVRMMDNVNDVSLFPLQKQMDQAKAKRRIGLGITGLADALLMCGLRYGSEEAAERTTKWMREIALAAYQTGIYLAAEKGPFPALVASDYVNGQNFVARQLPGKMKQQIMETGIRNSHYLSIAPTGTISLYAGNVSSGGEPIFAPSYTRKVLQPDGTKTESRVVDYAVALWEKMGGADQDGEAFQSRAALPPAYVDAQTLSPADHVRMQAALQPWIDTSISKTVNVPEDISFDDFKAVYELAYEQGCKGCTTYRPNEVTGSILSVDKPAEAPVAEEPTPADLEPSVEPEDRPDALPGQTYKIKLGGDHATYVTVTDIVTPMGRRPFEVFIATKNPEHQAWSTALTRMISAIFRRPHDSSFVVEELKAVFDPQGGGYWKGQYWHSTVAAIGRVIELHMESIGYIEPGKNWKLSASDHAPGEITEVDEAPATVTLTPGMKCCPKCFSTNLVPGGGCMTCADCGHSKCG